MGELGVHHDCATDKGSQRIWLDFPTWIFVCTCPKQFREQRLSEHLHSHSVQTWETKAFHAMMMLVVMMGSSELAHRSLVWIISFHLITAVGDHEVGNYLIMNHYLYDNGCCGDDDASCDDGFK